jgi:type IX secretion system substrate protein
MKPSDKNIDKMFEKAGSQDPLMKDHEIDQLLRNSSSPKVPLIERILESIIGVKKMNFVYYTLAAVVLTGTGIFTFGGFNSDLDINQTEKNSIEIVESAPDPIQPESETTVESTDEDSNDNKQVIVIKSEPNSEKKEIKVVQYKFTKSTSVSVSPERSDVKGINALELDEASLAKLGITTEGDEVSFYTRNGNSLSNNVLNCDSKTTFKVKRKQFFEFPIFPKIMTNVNGRNTYYDIAYYNKLRKQRNELSSQSVASTDPQAFDKMEFIIDSSAQVLTFSGDTGDGVSIEEMKKKMSELNIKSHVSNGKLNDSMLAIIDNMLKEGKVTNKTMILKIDGQQVDGDSCSQEFEFNINMNELVTESMTMLRDSLKSSNFEWTTDDLGLVVDNLDNNKNYIGVVDKIDSLNTKVKKFNISLMETPQNVAVFTMTTDINVSSDVDPNMIIPHEGAYYEGDFSTKKVGSIDQLLIVIESYEESIDDYLKLNKLIPVKVNLPDCDKYYILWYEPNEDFLAALPEDHREKLVSELEAFDKADNVCTDGPVAGEDRYLDLWRSCNGAVENFTVFPNPTSGNVNISYDLKENRDIIVAIHNLNGVKMMELAGKNAKSAGKWTENYNLNNLQPGMYLLSIQTNTGEKAVQRIILK